MLHQGIEHLTVDFAALKHRIEHMAAERLVVGQEVLVESGHSRAVEHHGGEVPEHGALDVVAQEHGLPVGHLHQRGIGCLLLDDRARLDEAERAAHNYRKERVRAAVRLDNLIVELF